MSKEPHQSGQNSLVYLAGIGAWSELSGFTTAGLESGQTTRCVRVDDLALIAIDVPEPMFKGSGAETRLKDVKWITPRAERHDAIVRGAHEIGPVMPVTFGTVFSDDAAMIASVSSDAERIGAFLASIADRDEYTLVIDADEGRLIDAVVDATIRDRLGPNAGAGARYVMERKIRLDAKRDLDARIADLRRSAIEALRPHVDGVRERKLQAESDTGRRHVANTSLLIHEAKLPAFDAALESSAEQLEAAGARVELIGPWPVYSFVPLFHDDDTGDVPGADAA